MTHPNNSESKAQEQRPDFPEWIKSKAGIDCMKWPVSDTTYLYNRLSWAFDAGRDCVWDQFKAIKSENQRLTEENKQLLADKKRLDWIQSVMYDDSNFIEIYLSGLRNFKDGHAQAYQIESNPWDKFMSLQAPNVREAIDRAIQKMSENGKN